MAVLFVDNTSALNLVLSRGCQLASNLHTASNLCRWVLLRPGTCAGLLASSLGLAAPKNWDPAPILAAPQNWDSASVLAAPHTWNLSSSVAGLHFPVAPLLGWKLLLFRT